MTLDYFKDNLFEVLNDTSYLPIVDIDTKDKENYFLITLKDGSQFKINCSTVLITRL